VGSTLRWFLARAVTAQDEGIPMQKVSPFLWFDSAAEEAALFYVSIFPNSSITSVSRFGDGAPGQAGSVFGVDFVLDGVQMQAINGAPDDVRFSDALSLFVRAETQPEIDDLWEKLTADGGEPGRCGWLKDRFGVSWQIVPPTLGELISGPDPERAGRAMQAMMGMTKLDIAALRAAYDG
jgi:predicted 3-demethylubiquinone-9 3-methyltransferase (glyoxalase superfamily)